MVIFVDWIIFIYMEKIVTNTNFSEILATDKPVLVDFWASWCGPCRMLAPTVEEIGDEYEGKAVVAKCNVDDADEIAAQCGIRNIPTLIYFKNGQAVDRTVGVVSKADIESRLNSLL